MGEPTKGQEMTTQHPEALRLADELDAVPETGADPQTIQEAAAELRRQHTRIAELQARIKTMAEEHADELMVAHMDGRMRAAQPASGLDPELGPMLDFANAGEIAYYDYAVAQHCRATLDILDGKYNGAGACNEPWASVRKRLLSIVELHQSSSAAQGGSVPAGVQQPDTAYADLPPLPDPDLRDVGTKPEDIKNFLRGYATEYAKAALASSAPADSVLEDAARLDWLDQQCEAYGFQDIHEGNRWEISGAYANVRKAIDAERAARKQGANHD
jgi:hypothetical protein